ncbi:MAG: potassium channel family protein [Pseudomonadota bacterium]
MTGKAACGAFVGRSLMVAYRQMKAMHNSVWYQRFGQFGLLTSLISAFILPPFFGSSTFLLHLLVMLSLTFVLLSVLPFKRQFLLLAPMVFIELFATANLTINDSADALILFYAVSGIFFGTLVLLFVLQLFSPSRVDGNLLLASINTYFALGVTFAMVFGLIDHMVPGSFSISISSDDTPNSTEFMYFSLVTLSTLGYGDVLPVSDQARTLAAIEALAGQVYLTIAVARLVGMHVSSSESSRGDR